MKQGLIIFTAVLGAILVGGFIFLEMDKNESRRVARIILCKEQLRIMHGQIKLWRTTVPEDLTATRFSNEITKDQFGNPLDPWGRPFVYIKENDSWYQLYSVGDDGVDDSGKGDDIKGSR